MRFSHSLTDNCILKLESVLPHSVADSWALKLECVFSYPVGIPSHNDEHFGKIEKFHTNIATYGNVAMGWQTCCAIMAQGMAEPFPIIHQLFQNRNTLGRHRKAVGLVSQCGHAG